MKISLSTPRLNIKNPKHGYGHACNKIIKSLNYLGHEVKYQDPTALFQFNFSQPPLYKLHKDQYQIAYTPWESTTIPPDWFPKLKLCDEIWTTSDWCANVFEDHGFKDVKVYAHGIDPVWKPKRRQESDVLKFLHVGEPSVRKGGQLVVDAFIHLFGNDSRYSLTIKTANDNTTRVYNNYIDKQIIGLPHEIYSNIYINNELLEEDALVNLYHQHDVLVYPSAGEGFGFIPFQALATGMPTISTYDWAQYKNYLGPLKLKSTTKDSEWDLVHPGKVFEPNYQHLLERMRDVAINFNAYSGYYYAQSDKIHKEYNWNRLTKNAFDNVIKKFS